MSFHQTHNLLKTLYHLIESIGENFLNPLIVLMQIKTTIYIVTKNYKYHSKIQIKIDEKIDNHICNEID